MSTQAADGILSEAGWPWWAKGFGGGAGDTGGLASVTGVDLFAGRFEFPLMVLKDTALQHNITVMAAYCAEQGVNLSPHAKTPLSPQVIKRQIAAGAWGMTVATVHQARVLRRSHIGRILLANELLDGAGLRWVSRELAADPRFDFYCLADSAAAVSIMDRALEEAGAARRVGVLVELGAGNGRCGCRAIDEGYIVGEAVAGSRHLRLAGVETYEAMVDADELGKRLGLMDQLLSDLRSLASGLDQRGLFGGCEEIVVSAGGSMYLDRVTNVLAGPWTLSRPVRVVVRPGVYVAHDGAEYARLSPFGERGTASARLRQALEVWSSVLSVPEPGLCILGFGKRDVSHDRGFPMPFALRGAEGGPVLGLSGIEVLSLNDHHARVAVPPGLSLAVGDMVGCHISHPCTAFQNWHAVPVVDDDYRVREVAQSYL